MNQQAHLKKKKQLKLWSDLREVQKAVKNMGQLVHLKNLKKIQLQATNRFCIILLCSTALVIQLISLESLYCWTTINWGITSVLEFQIKVYYKIDKWINLYSNKK